MAEPGRCVSGYRLEELQGDLGPTTAWRVTELRRGVPLGMRILAPEALPWAEAFRTAVTAQRALIHPNRLQVLDLIELDGAPAAITEHVAGPSLATWLRVRRRGLGEVIPVFEEVMRGVAAGHHQGLYQLAIDAGQIWMQSRRGMFVPKVDVSVGAVIAAAAADGRTLHAGRLPAPAPLDARADLYLLGTLLYEMVTRRLPFDAHALASGPPRPPRLAEGPPELAELVERLLARKPTARPASVDAVLALLAPEPTPDGHGLRPGPTLLPDLEGSQAGSRPGSLPEVAVPARPPAPTPHPVVVATAVAVGLVAVGGLVAWLG